MSGDGSVRFSFLDRFVASFARTPRSGDSGDRSARRLVGLCETLLAQSDEGSELRLARRILAAYEALDVQARSRFFTLLAEQFGPDVNQLARAAETFLRDPTPTTIADVQDAASSRRRALFQRLNVTPACTRDLVTLRQHLLTERADHPGWTGIDADLTRLFRSWFSGAFLSLQRINWNTSALVLERLIHYEAVHQIAGWHDLRRRLAEDRRCYAFFHPALPEDPVIFIEVALTREMSATIEPLLDPDAPIVDAATARCAMFYSITNCHEGLRGVAFGHLLIKQVVEDLARTVPGLRTFATLSPVVGFRQWLAAQMPGDPADLGPGVIERLRPELMRWCARYLLSTQPDRSPIDAVARFHLSNGARLERLNWMGDQSTAGMDRGLGMMANYVYRLKDLDRNHHAYASGRIVVTHEIESLAKWREAGARDSPLPSDAARIRTAV